MPLDHAIVLGGSIAGLLAAAALSDSFSSVTIVEQDQLPVDGPEARQARKGVPHGLQTHHMLSLGRDNIEALLPGFDQELVREGGEHRDPIADFAQYIDGTWIVRVHSGLTITCFQRPTLELAVRRRVLGYSNVEVVQGAATGLVVSADGRRTLGVTIGDGRGYRMDADLVVDATGRGSKSARWLDELGYGRPDESQLKVYMAYSTFLLRFNGDDAMPDGLHGISSTSGTAGAAIRPCGEGIHMFTAGGVMRNYPPRALDEYPRYLDSLGTPLVGRLLKQAEVISDVETFRMVGNHRRYWERLHPRPEGFVLVGDAVSYFNPMYGQGMTTAALGATVLREVATKSDGKIEGFVAAAQDAIGDFVDVAFGNAVRLDSVYPGVEYVNLEPPARDPKVEQAMRGLQTEDPEVAIGVRKAILNMDNSFLQTESIQSKVAEWIRSERTVKVTATDPLALPQLAN